MKTIPKILPLLFLCFGIKAFSSSTPLISENKKTILKADKILVEKSRREMHLLKAGKIIKTYRIGLGFNPEGKKEEQGDGKTPEGLYVIDAHNPQSSYHYSLHISYPSRQDVAQATARGVSPGGAIMIHGYPKGFDWAGSLTQRPPDWTLGCIAVRNFEIDEIAKAVPVGTPIEILP